MEAGSSDEGWDAQRARAEEAVRRMAEGADPGVEAFELSNRFTDAATSRFAAVMRRMLRRSPQD